MALRSIFSIHNGTWYRTRGLCLLLCALLDRDPRLVALPGQKPTATSGGPFSLVIPAGTMPEKKLYGLKGQLLCVENFAGNLDPLTGDFSGPPLREGRGRGLRQRNDDRGQRL